MNSPLLLSLFAGLATLFIVLGWLRPQEGLFSAQTRNTLRERVDIKLKRAGIVTVSPASVILGVIIAMGMIFAIGVFGFGQVAIAATIAIATPLFFSLYLDRKARHYQDKLTGRLVPFLRKITAQVRTGQNPTRAFAVAAHEDPLLAWVLREQLANLQMQQSFQDVLRDSLNAIPLRPWVQFVRSMESFSRSGGELSEILDSNVSRIQSQVILRQRLMGDVSTYRAQQLIILGFALIIPAALALMSPDIFGKAFTSPSGIIVIFVALGIDAFALWLTSSAIKDVESKMEA